MIDRVLLCWGKIEIESEAGRFHPALFHMIDVGNVARVLLSSNVSPRWKNTLSVTFNDFPDNLPGWIPWMVAMHDIGKISSAFQAQVPAQTQRLEQMDFHLRPLMDLKHPIIGAYFIKKYYSNSLPVPIITIMKEMVAGHHGQFPVSGEINSAGKRLQRDENPEWIDLRQAACQCIEAMFLKPDIIWPTPNNISSALMAISGFTILCDWIGSNSTYFSVEDQMDVFEYSELSLQRAELAVRESGFCQSWVSDAPTEVSKLFTNLTTLRPLQMAIDNIPQVILEKPCLAIIEAPTGEGKTEAALALAHRIGESRKSDEIYYALPTAATSNQMYQRLCIYLRDQLKIITLTKLIHSQAYLIEDDILMQPLTNGKQDSSDQSAVEWFSSKKRALLAPFGVGTIDQAELGALNVRHNMLRLMGLAGKTIILDEVHAYDTYMTTIIERLLTWLSALGTSVVILTATLPQSRRRRLAKAYGVNLPTDDRILDRYPCLLVGNPSGYYSDSPAASQPDRKISVRNLQLSRDEPETQARWLLNQLGSEGCACWITNTIDRAQAIYRALEELAEPDVQITLIHSRFCVADRQILEERVAKAYGPNGIRPKRGIVIGTQVLEQSLDLDFDVMVSDLAPVDLLLQRSGRLHRHQRTRPAQHQFPNLWIHSQPGKSNYPNFNTDKRIYYEYLLMRTWNVLQNRDSFNLPTDYRILISKVYDAGEPDSSDSDLFIAWKNFQKKETFERGEASNRLVPLPSPITPFTMNADLVFEENEDKASWIIAKTRLGEETVTVVPMARNGQVASCLDTNISIPTNKTIDKKTQLSILRRSIKLSGQDLCAAVRSQERPVLFTGNALLKDIYPLWMVDHRAVLKYEKSFIEFVLDPRLGLVINRQKG